MNRHLHSRLHAVVAACACGVLAALLGTALWNGGPARAAVTTGRTGEVLTYASPVETLISPDGARLYVLCQGSDEVRVLDAVSFKVIKNISVGQVPRRRESPRRF